jgi:hypothetical protein
MVGDYYNWEKVTNGVVSQEQEYATAHLTTAAINWIAEQDNPWFLWLAHAAPHAPFHVPPAGTYSIENTDGRTNKYLAAIESMDYEIGRLLENMEEKTLNNTIIVFIGDNGTPGPVIQYFPEEHAKSSLYEGGVRVPMIISGAGVDRKGEEEYGLTHVADLYATILEIAGMQLPGGINNSLSIKPALSCSDNIKRDYIYTDYSVGNTLRWAIRNDVYKLIAYENGEEEFYNISTDLLESNNLINNLTSEEILIKEELAEEAQNIRSDWSCNDGIKNGLETTIDDCNNACPDDDILSTTNIGCCEEPSEPSIFYEYFTDNSRNIYTNDFPNHAYCYNPNRVPEQTYYHFKIDRNPQISDNITQMIRDNGRPARYFGVAKNGVVMAPAPSTPFIFENPNTGQFNWDWVFEPTNNQGDGMDLVALDCASAHTGPQGYHYHGNMFEYVEHVSPGISTTDEAPQEIIHIGWASDGFPILYRFGPDDKGEIKELLPSFQLRSGLRPGDGTEEPCGPYTGKYTKDYEYVCGKGDLDECNGINRSITLPGIEGSETFEYFYVISETFPQIPRCLVGMASSDFDNSRGPLNGVDMDGDGFISAFDCNDSDRNINPLAAEIKENTIDENCDGILTSAAEINKVQSFKIGPNPSHGELFIDLEGDDFVHVYIYDEAGRSIKKQSSHGDLVIKDLPKGVFIVQILSEARSQLYTEKIIVN